MCFTPLYVICYWFIYQTFLATRQWSRITNSDVITGVMRVSDGGVAAAGQPGDRLCKQTLFIAALDSVAAFFFSLHDFNFDICQSRM
jgi:DNA-binding transcriptional regulator of glucitol operon